MLNIENIAQAAANAAYDAVMAIADAHTAPAAPALPTQAPAPQAAPAQATGTDGAADAFAAFRMAFGVPASVWRKVAPKGSNVRAQVRAAYVGPFDRRDPLNSMDRAQAAFGPHVPAMQALAAEVLAAAGVPAPATQAAAATAPQAPVSEVLTGLFGAWGITPEQAPQAPVKQPKQQPTGTVALNGLKRLAKAQRAQGRKVPTPTRADDVPAHVYALAFDYVESQRAQGLPCDADAVATHVAARLGM